MTQLSAHFTLRELTRSSTARRRGIDNTPDKAALAHLKRLCETVLEPLRVHLNRPITVNSGYRGPRLNRAIRGARRSAHLTGRAADIECPGMANRQLAEHIVALGLPFDKVILEFPGPQPDDGWVHVQIARTGNEPREQQLVAYRGRWPRRTRYAVGFDVPNVA